MKKTYPLFEQYIAYILLVSLLLQSCGGEFNNNPLIPTGEKQIAFIQTDVQAILLPTNIQPLVGQELTAQGGHMVTCYEEAGQLKADVAMNAPRGFSKTYAGLSVAVEQGAELANLSRLDTKAQERRIRLQLAQDNQPAKIVIYKGAGLVGGMLEGEEETAEDELANESIPDECFCPITQEIMEDPVIAQDGHTYERTAIKRWLGMGKRTSPKTGARLLSTEVIPNYTMRSLIQDIKAQVPVLARHQLDMHNIEAAIKLREEEMEEKLIQKGSLIEKESQERLRLEEELQQKIALLSVVEQKEKSNHPGLPQHPLQISHPEKLTDKRDIRKHFFKGMLEITPKNYQILLKHSISSEAAFHSYDKGLSVKGWPVSMGMDSLMELLVSFSKVTRFKMDINWDTAGQEEEVGEAIARSLQFYEQLTSLELSGCRLSNASWQEIVACIPQPICLKELDVRNNLLTEEIIRNIPGRFPNLIRLELDVKREVLVSKKEGYTTMSSNTVQGTTSEAKVAKIKDELLNESIDYYLLGIKYENEEEVAKDEVKAFEWFQKAAEKGYANAQNKLGVMYANGKGVEKDDEKALEWFQKAAEQGDANAQNNLGVMYAYGKGVEKDDEKALEWFQKAADQNHEAALFNQLNLELGVMYANGKGVEKDDEKAFEWFQKNADQEHAAAQARREEREEMYGNRKRKGVEKDEVKVFEWYQKAANQGDVYAQSNLGWRYAYGKGVKKDEVQAFKWYQKAAEQGDANSQFNLGEMYDKDKGKVVGQLRQDFKKALAFEWYQKAAEQGHAEAQYVLAKRYIYGNGVIQDGKKGLEWYQKAAEQGHVASQYQLGHMYEYGRGVEKDKVKAFKWYQKAAKQGHAGARDTLKTMK